MLPDYIDSGAALRALTSDLDGSDSLGLDTEFVRERTYYPQLCLVQLATAGRIVCVDTLACDDLSPLAELLAGVKRTKILHAARQDVEVLLHLTEAPLQPIFDTQVAAAMLGLADQISYSDLVARETGVELGSSQARTDWKRRPLKPAQLSYAADDVRHLAALEENLTEKLAARGRVEWHAEEMRALKDPSLYTVEPRDAWRKIKGITGLNAGVRAIAESLAEWRELRAAKRDRPRQWILRDHALIDLAHKEPRDKSSLAEIRDLPPTLRDAAADGLLAAIRDGAEREPTAMDAVRLPTGAEKKLVGTLMGAIRDAASKHEVSQGLLCNRRDATRMVLGERDLRVLRGWRRGVVGENLLALL